jgi:acetyl esterase/lipase
MTKQTCLLLALGMAISGSACTGENSDGPSVPVSDGPSVSVSPRIELGITYASPDGVPLKLDAYVPGSPGPHPGVILIHGGGFRVGDRTWETYLATALVDAGFAAFSIDYRLAPEFSFPAAVDDVLTAVAWVRAHATEYGVDPGRIGAIGESAGAHLAAMLGVLGRGSLDVGSRVAAVVSWSGPMDLSALVRDAGDVVSAGLRIRELVEQFLGCRGTACARLFRKASPVTFVDPSDAPMLLVNSVDEFIPIGEAREMAAELRRAAVSVRVIEMPGAEHAGGYADDAVPGSSGTVLDASIAFLRSEL